MAERYNQKILRELSEVADATAFKGREISAAMIIGYATMRATQITQEALLVQAETQIQQTEIMARTMISEGHKIEALTQNRIPDMEQFNQGHDAGLNLAIQVVKGHSFPHVAKWPQMKEVLAGTIEKAKRTTESTS